MISINNVKEVVAEFGLSPSKIRRSTNALVSPVFILDNTHIAKARHISSSSEAKINNENALLEFIGPHFTFKVPSYLSSRSGMHYVLNGEHLWTIHLLLTGKPAGSWYCTTNYSRSNTNLTLSTLRIIHQTTKNIDVTRFLSAYSTIKAAKCELIKNPTWLNVKNRRRIENAVNIAEYECSLLQQNGGDVILHGDLHQGNILTGLNTNVTGVIDWDDARGGHACDDAGFTIMMLLRDYLSWSPTPSPKKLIELLKVYGAKGYENLLIWEFIIIWAFLDAQKLFRRTFPDVQKYLDYQRAFCCALLDMNIPLTVLSEKNV